MRISSSVCVTALTVALVAFPAFAGGQTRDIPPPPPVPRQPGTPPIGVRMGTLDPRDRPPTPTTGTASIRGRVTDALTGRAIARARVRLMGPHSRGPVLTDESGVFMFDALPAGAYRVIAEKSTYLPAQHPDISRSIRMRGASIQLADRQEFDVTLTMFHSGAIAGRVVDAYGDPVESANVTVLFVPRSGRPTQRANGVTNDLGEYRVSRLQPGRYLVRVRPQHQFQPELPNAKDKPLPQALPVYFPNAIAPDQAQVVVVNRGETVAGLDVTLAEGIPTTVSGIVLASDGRQFAGGNLSYRSAAAGEGGGVDGGTSLRPDGTFRVQIPPGEYVFEARAQPGPPGQNVVYRQETELYGSVRVTVAGEVLEGLAIPIGSGATASGRIVFEGTTPPPVTPPAPMRIPMYNPDGPGCRPGFATIEADWSFKVEGLGGACSSPPGSAFGRWTLKAVMVGAQNLMDQVVTFQPGQHYGNVRIVVTDKRPTVDFRVVDESGQPAVEFAILVFPADKDRWTQLSRFVRTMAVSPPPPRPASLGSRMPDGMAAGIATRMPPTRMTGIAAGDYYAIAIDDMDPEDTQDPSVLEKLISSAVRFSATEAPVEVPLRRTPLAEIIR